MRHLLALVCLFALSTVAFAQSIPSAVDRALSNKLLAEINAGVTCNANVITLSDELAKAQARIKELETKTDAKPDALEK